MPENVYNRLREYVSALRGEEFQEMDSNKMWKIIRISMAEALGTAIFVGLGCSALVAFPGTQVNHLYVVFAFSLAVNLVIASLGHISGAYINPSLTMVGLVTGRLSLPMFFVYTFSQLAGGIMGLSAVKAVSPEGCVAGGFCMTEIDPVISVNQALLAETLMTFCLGLLFCGACDSINSDKMDSVSLKFAFSIVAIAFAGGKFTGCSMNPARSFAPAFLAGNWTNHWVYWLGPMTGGLLAGLFYRLVLSEAEINNSSGKEETVRPTTESEKSSDTVEAV